MKQKNITKKKKNYNGGITLIALVITIIILLVLAGITIATLTGDNGLLQKTTDSKGKTLDAEIEEEVRLAWNKVYADSYIENYTIEQKAGALLTELSKTGKTDSNTKVTGKGTLLSIEQYRGKDMVLDVETGRIADSKWDLLPSIEAGEKNDNSNSVYTSGNYKAVIPKGFTVSNVKVINEITEEVEKDETTIENGLVVRDGSNNEWVWIPVSSSDLALMYTEDQTGWTMLGTTVVTKCKTSSSILGSRILNRTSPGLTADPYYREPDVLSSYDTDQTYRTQAGFGDLTDMATKLKDDYKEMIESVRENGGFYVGRYELGKDSNNNPQVKAGTVMNMNNKNWYESYKACKSFTNENVESRMIWGCQWDQICRFIKENGENSIIDDSRSYGNHSDSTGNAAINSGPSNFNNTTGRSEYWKIKNMYDIAGNCSEWTQEAVNTSRVSRGRKLE